MRTVRGTIVLPPDVPAMTAPQAFVEVRDVSTMDAPSLVVAEHHATDVELEPGGRVPFQLAVPEAEPDGTLAVRAHLSLTGTPTPHQGDLLTVTPITVQPTGDVDDVEVPVELI